jgi:hypothetical protein
MPDLKLVCDNCGSSFALSYDDEEVSYSPSHCPFCGDFYDNDADELNFNDDIEEDTLFDEEDDPLKDDDEDDEDENDRHWN